ncbi:MAG: peptidylprolyl isomerase [Oscillospiraceae bacterium]|nr:peptidylprolyl isomerase [Oscillospiraceae bacterium]MBR6208356.1 peptidylprolyl isomerase [Oscillospiraceae bacterium]
MKKTLAALLSVVLLLCVLAGCSSNKTWTGKHDVEITVANYGTFTVEVNADAAPQTASQFLNLAKSGFYNKKTVYRAIAGFAIYGGDPNKNGTGTSGSTIPGEFSSNGFRNPLSHTRGAIGMARDTNKDSASCRFYIMQSDQTFLDGDFAVFGYVSSGMEIVDQIAAGAHTIGADGYIAESNQPVITSMKVK